MRSTVLLALASAALLVSGCDRSIEPFDPDEQVEQPDLTRIFPEGARRVAQRDRESEGGMGSSLPTPPGGRTAPAGGSEDAPPIRGTLVLAPEFADAVPSGAVLFLVARKPSGGPPVAVKRIMEPRFPLPFELGPGDRMIQAIPFEGPLLLTARVDGDGNATSREPGDLLGSAADAVEPGAEGVTIRLDEQL